MGRDHGPQVKDDAVYEALREQGASKEKAARIANATGASARGGRSPVYEEWTRSELYARAQDLNIKNRSKMTKAELIAALRGA